MQSSNKKLKIIIGIIIAVVIIALITGIVLYFTTDIFKSKKDMFNTYLLQDFNTINNIVDLSKETEYRKKLENNNFDENSTVELKYKDIDGNEDLFNATIEGINNNSENKAYKDIKITSKDTNVMEMKYLKENEIYGLHFMDIAEKFATIDTSSNVNPIFEYFGLGDIVSSDSIKPINLSELFDLSEDEKSQILNDYLSIVLQNVSKKDYYAEKDNVITLSNNESITANSYILKLNTSQVEEIYKSILQQLTEDKIILGKIENIDNKLKEMGISLNKDIKTQFIENINKRIQKVKIENDLIVTVYELNGTTVRTEVKYGYKTIQIDLDPTSENNMTIKYTDVVSGERQETDVAIRKNDNELDINYEDYKGKKIEVIRNLQSNENDIKSVINIKYSDKEKINELEINYDRNITLGTNSQIPTSFEKVGKVLLNDYQGESIDYAFTTLKNRIIKAVRTKRDEINSTLLGYIVELNNQKQENAKKEKENQRKRFNSKFELYKGQDIEQGVVFNLLDEAGKNMSDYKITKNNQITLYIKEGQNNENLAKEIKDKLSAIDESVQYNINIGYDENSLINKITIDLIEEKPQN